MSSYIYLILFVLIIIICAVSKSGTMREGLSNPQCPTGYTQVGGLGADIGGCGTLESCNDRYDKFTVGDCATHCSNNSECKSFSWAPLNGDRNAKNKTVCTTHPAGRG